MSWKSIRLTNGGDGRRALPTAARSAASDRFGLATVPSQQRQPQVGNESEVEVQVWLSDTWGKRPMLRGLA